MMMGTHQRRCRIHIQPFERSQLAAALSLLGEFEVSASDDYTGRLALPAVNADFLYLGGGAFRRSSSVKAKMRLTYG